MPQQPRSTGRVRVPVPRASVDQRPRLPRVYIPRTLLWQRLDEATENPLTLLVGPMGAGKSLGVSGWLHERGPRDALWVQGHAALGPETLQRYLLDVRAARTSGPARRRPEGDQAAARPRRRLVVIDDAHLLPPAAIGLLDDRLSSDPQSLRILLLSRWDLPITRLGPQLLGHFTVLRGDLLRLN